MDREQKVVVSRFFVSLLHFLYGLRETLDQFISSVEGIRAAWLAFLRPEPRPPVRPPRRVSFRPPPRPFARDRVERNRRNNLRADADFVRVPLSGGDTAYVRRRPADLSRFLCCPDFRRSSMARPRADNPSVSAPPDVSATRSVDDRRENGRVHRYSVQRAERDAEDSDLRAAIMAIQDMLEAEDFPFSFSFPGDTLAVFADGFVNYPANGPDNDVVPEDRDPPVGGSANEKPEEKAVPVENSAPREHCPLSEVSSLDSDDESEPQDEPPVLSPAPVECQNRGRGRAAWLKGEPKRPCDCSKCRP